MREAPAISGDRQTQDPDPVQRLDDLAHILKAELVRTERHMQVATEEALKRSVAKIEGLLHECTRGPSAFDEATKPLRSSLPPLQRKSLTLHHDNKGHHNPFFHTPFAPSGRPNPWKDDRPGARPSVQDLAMP
ncbi:dis3l2 [Symbiodinium pilosum]|uniref:Dis3l2 protein n=1 Tax=Symbiodinium pilosum TaxID=2952 RepID=A0A812REP7_SYMPI|nr:dis3l2 [Symbiodinium pilosum]